MDEVTYVFYILAHYMVREYIIYSKKIPQKEYSSCRRLMLSSLTMVHCVIG